MDEVQGRHEEASSITEEDWEEAERLRVEVRSKWREAGLLPKVEVTPIGNGKFETKMTFDEEDAPTVQAALELLYAAGEIDLEVGEIDLEVEENESNE